MEEKLAISRHFFKVMIPGFQKKMNLPPAFCKKLNQEKSEWAMLKSRKGTWKIQVCRNCEDLISFEVGWPEFVDGHSMSTGDLVVFEHVGGLFFNVYVFDPSACGKEIDLVRESKKESLEAVNPSRHSKKTKRDQSEKESAGIISYDSKNPHFITTMKPHHAHKHGSMTIPIEFVRSNDLGGKTSATLRDARGRAWPVTIRVRRTPYFRVLMRRGWHDFYESNELKEGDACAFYLNPSSPRSTTVAFDVKVVLSPFAADHN